MKTNNGGKMMRRVIKASIFLSVTMFLVLVAIAIMNSTAFAQEHGAEGTAGKGGGGLGNIGAALAVGLSALGTGYAQSKIGAAGTGALVEKPELTGIVIALVAIPETMVILGFVIALLK